MGNISTDQWLAGSGAVGRDGDLLAIMAINSDPTGAARLDFYSDSTIRWSLSKSGTETGSDAGSGIALRSFDDDGLFIDEPFSVVRAADGLITIGRPLTSARTPTITTATTATGFDVQSNITITGGNRIYVTDGTDYVALHPDNGVELYRSSSYIRNTQVGGSIAVLTSYAAPSDRTAISVASTGAVTFYSSVVAGNGTSIRGTVVVRKGTTSQPGAILLESANGTDWYLFVEDDGTLKIHSAAPAGNTDGVEVGGQS